MVADTDGRIIELLVEIRDLLARGSPVTQAGAEVAHQQPPAMTGHGEAEVVDACQALLSSRRDAEKWDPVWDSRAALDKWLAVLAIAEEEIGEGTALTAPEIERILVGRFRLPGVLATNVNRDLRNARQYVRRQPRGRGNEYWLTRQGLKYITDRREALRRA